MLVLAAALLLTRGCGSRSVSVLSGIRGIFDEHRSFPVAETPGLVAKGSGVVVIPKPPNPDTSQEGHTAPPGGASGQGRVLASDEGATGTAAASDSLAVDLTLVDDGEKLSADLWVGGHQVEWLDWQVLRRRSRWEPWNAYITARIAADGVTPYAGASYTFWEPGRKLSVQAGVGGDVRSFSTLGLELQGARNLTDHLRGHVSGGYGVGEAAGAYIGAGLTFDL